MNRDMEPSDTDLLISWRNGDKRAGQILVKRKYLVLERFFLNKVSSNVADLVQETLLACVKNHTRIEDDSKFSTYLFSIAYNVLRLHLRERYRQGGHVEFEEVCVSDLDPSPSQLLARRQQQRLLLEALRAIPIAHQVLLELFYWERMTSDEIAAALQMPSGTVRGRLRRARELLARAMKRLSNSTRPLHSTLTQLDDWAESCRHQLPGVGG